MAAQAKKYYYTQDTRDWTANGYIFKNFIDSLNATICSATLEDERTVFLNIDNNVILKFYFGSSTSDCSTYININNGGDVRLFNGDGIRTCGSHDIRIIYSDTFFYLHFYGGAGPRIIWVCYEKISNNNYCGYASSGSVATKTISDLVFYDIETNLQYTHKQRLNYSKSIVDSLDFTNECLFSGSYVTNIISNELLACSTVPADSLISFGGKNYYSLSTNTLIEVETEQ